MTSPLPAAAQCLRTLLRYESAAVRCYQFAERTLKASADRDALAAIRRDHEAVTAALAACLAARGIGPSTETGLWGVLAILAETTARMSGRRALIDVLLWSERHAVQMYQAAGRIPALAAFSQVFIPGTVLPALTGHIAALERLAGRPCMSARTEPRAALGAVARNC